MTLIVAVGNKNALCFAADSSGSYKHKTFNVDKLFQLSVNDSIGVGICGSSDFMNMFWEIIIKDYRKKNEVSFSTISECVEDFLNFLSTQNYINSISLEDYLNYALSAFKEFITFKIKELVDTKYTNLEAGEMKIAINNDIKLLVETSMMNVSTSPPIRGFEDIEYEDFLSTKGEFIKEYFEEILDIDDDFSNKLLEFIKLHFEKSRLQSGGSELIFFGFGQEEYCPMVRAIKLYYKVDSNIIYSESTNLIVDAGSIHTFAQGDEVMASLIGMSGIVKQKVIGSIRGNLTNIIEKYTIEEQDIKECEKLITDSIDIATGKYQGSLMEAVGLLSKDELGKVAENLVNIGSLKRRVSMDYETIGGPIDVLIVTKSEGLVRIKRKHYFDPKLNQRFYKNHYNL